VANEAVKINESQQAQGSRPLSVGKPERVCTRCVMDTTDSYIQFDEEGVCNHCREFEIKSQYRVLKGAKGREALEQIVEKIKLDGKGKEYDCIAGVSGGVDSTYVAYLAKELGLRPLAVHFDNGWNSELAVSNIETVLNKLGIDLYTYVVDWEEFRDLQLSFLKASTPDSEIPTDHAIYAVLMREARRHNISYILNGMNYNSEGIVVHSWAYGHSDCRYIKDVQRRFGSVKLKSYPYYSLWDLFYTMIVRRVKFVSILNYIDFDKTKAVEFLGKELGWRSYSGKHHESIYTRFFQSYILPRKFNIDKRKAHLSNLLQSGSEGLTREKALEELKNPPCDPELMEQDRQYLIKKFNLTAAEFDQIMALPVKSYRDYNTNYSKIVLLKRLQHYLRNIGVFYK